MAKMCSNCKGQIAVTGNYIEKDGKIFCIVCARKNGRKKKP